jgi:hypothetical protein
MSEEFTTLVKKIAHESLFHPASPLNILDANGFFELNETLIVVFLATKHN